MDLFSIEGALIFGGAVLATEFGNNMASYNATKTVLKEHNPSAYETSIVHSDIKQFRREHPFLYCLIGGIGKEIALKKYGKGLPL